jgi:hypothetical protein
LVKEWHAVLLVFVGLLQMQGKLKQKLISCENVPIANILQDFSDKKIF